MNNLTIAGRIGNDAEVRFTQGGEPICSFSVAVDSKVKGEKVTTWFRCAIFGSRAEALAPYLTKGTVVAVSGPVSARAYLPKGGGDPQVSIDVKVSELSLLGGGKPKDADNDGFSTPKPEGRGRGRAQAPAPVAPADLKPGDPGFDPFGDDVPF